MTNILDNILQNNLAGQRVGIASICSAHPAVLEAAISNVRETNFPLLVEATCNQINQYGGYTGMTPANFVHYILSLCDHFSLPHEQLILGGDHLGPNVWKKEPVEQAMEKSRVLVHDFVLAGFQKIHLDTSMHLGSDPNNKPLPPELVAERTAQLAQVAEQAYATLGAVDQKIRYVIGTEVPPPGGIQGEGESVHITSVENVKETINLTRQAFQSAGLESAWERVIAVVVHPGVEFGNEVIFPYEQEKTTQLRKFIESQNELVFEAHSTDYQNPEALSQMVEDHFAILKVGPWLTFAYREGVYALEMIERELLSNQDVHLSDLRNTLEKVMLQEPTYWQGYYNGSSQPNAYLLHYSFSDRIRYYWAIKAVQEAVARLMKNLSAWPIPLSLLSQYLPAQYESIRAGLLVNTPQAIVQDTIQQVLKKYNQACGQN